MQRKVRIFRRADFPGQKVESFLDRRSNQHNVINETIRLRAKIELLSEDQIRVLDKLIESLLP